jgi:uncharacterized membrane protein YcjF (UPF0283 family)
VTIVIVINVIVGIYIISLRPFSTPYNNWLQVANRAIVVLLCIIIMILAREKSWDREEADSIGLAFVIVVMLGVVANFIAVVVDLAIRVRKIMGVRRLRSASEKSRFPMPSL